MITTLTIKLLEAIGIAKFLTVIAVFVPLERLAPHRGAQPVFRDGWVTDLLSYLVNGTLFAAILFGWHRLMPQGGAWVQTLPPPFNFQGQPVIVQAVAVLAVGSFVYYWGHRALHRFAFLWRFHSVHHSAEHLDWLATYRGHVLETCYFTALTSIPMAMLGLSTPMILAFVVYRFFEGQIEHSNVRVPLGPLRWVFPSPWFHHWHHSLDVATQNKNFSPYPVWDVLFGTAFMPAGQLPTRFGVDAPVPKGYLGQLAYPFGLAHFVERLQRRVTTG